MNRALPRPRNSGSSNFLRPIPGAYLRAKACLTRCGTRQPLLPHVLLMYTSDACERKSNGTRRNPSIFTQYAAPDICSRSVSDEAGISKIFSSDNTGGWNLDGSNGSADPKRFRCTVKIGN